MHSNGRVDIATDAPERLPRYACLYRNEVYLYRREGLRGWLYLLSRTALHLLRALRAPDGRRRAGIVWRSFCAGLHFAPAVEYLSDELPGPADVPPLNGFICCLLSVLFCGRCSVCRAVCP